MALTMCQTGRPNLTGRIFTVTCAARASRFRCCGRNIAPITQKATAIPGSASFTRGGKAILPFSLGAQTRHFGLNDQKRLSHGRWKSIQIKGLGGRSGHAPSYPSRP